MSRSSRSKQNGVRALALQGRIVTREAVPLDCALHCADAIRHIEREYGEPMVIDAEYVEAGGLGATLSAMRRGEGAAMLLLLDAVPYRDWQGNRFQSPFPSLLDEPCTLPHGISRPHLAYLNH